MDECTTVNKDDPFAYLERNKFTSEKYKIEIRGLPKFYGIHELKKLLNEKLSLNTGKIKPPKSRSGWLYVCFRSEEDRQRAIQTLNGFSWKNKILSAQEASAVPDPLVKKRLSQQKPKVQDEPNSSSEQNVNRNDLKSITVPLWNVPYEEQLKIKMKCMNKLLLRLTEQLTRENRSWMQAKTWLQNKCAENGNGLVSKLAEIAHVPDQASVPCCRNKCEFSIGINGETGEKTVGFRLGAYVQGSISVSPVDELPHISTTMKKVVKVFEEFIRKSEFEIYNGEHHTGYWKQLTVRFAERTNQLMVIAVVHMDMNDSRNQDEVRQTIKQQIVHFFESNEDAKSCNVHSLYLETFTIKLAANATNDKFQGRNLELLLGSATITEQLAGMKFAISPDSFFQPYTAAAEILYNKISEILQPLDDRNTILDICCGTGSIGLSLAKSGAQILGIEKEPAAVENAISNSKENGVQDNSNFYAGKAEDILSLVMSKCKNDDIVAIVDPPRSGLHQKTVIQLRKWDRIKKLVFVSCDPYMALKNFVALGRPPSKTLLGLPFFPVLAQPVDNFPYTRHCELILYFERYSPNSVNVDNNVVLETGNEIVDRAAREVATNNGKVSVPNVAEGEMKAAVKLHVINVWRDQWNKTPR